MVENRGLSGRLLHLVFWLAATLAAANAGAQEMPGTFEFSFSNPGARSLGLGGAFSGLADDATAAFANPAGLLQLLKPEVSIEARHWSFSTPFTEGGRFLGSPTGIGLDTSASLSSGVSSQDIQGLSFLALVYPKSKWAVALYRHQLARFRARTETQGLFGQESGPWGPRRPDRRWFTELDIVATGISGAYRMTERLSLGFAIVHFDGQLDAPVSLYLPDDTTSDGIFAPSSYLTEQQIYAGDWTENDTDWGLSAGFHWSPTALLSVGGFYRRGPKFDLWAEMRAGPSYGVTDPLIPAAPGEVVALATAAMRFPDVYGLGIAWRSPEGRLTVGFEWDRIEYSAILDSLDPTLVMGPEDFDLDVDLAASDGDELRVGIEYVFLDSIPVIALRCGAWLDPDHRFHSIKPDAEHRALYPPGQDEYHLAAGFGLAFENFQIDLGGDFSDLVDTISLSVIYSF